MWLANFEDGSTVASKQKLWTELPRDKRMTGLLLFHPEHPYLRINLSEMDRYYFTSEAIAFYGQRSPSIVAEIIGGHSLELGVGVEIRLENNGTVHVRHYPVERFRYGREILLEGKGVNRKKSPEPTLAAEGASL